MTFQMTIGRMMVSISRVPAEQADRQKDSAARAEFWARWMQIFSATWASKSAHRPPRDTIEGSQDEP